MGAIDTTGRFPQIYDEYLALTGFLSDLPNAHNSLDVENLWHTCISVFQASALSLGMGLVPIANNLRVLVMSEFAKATGSAMGAVLSAFLPILSTVTTGLG